MVHPLIQEVLIEMQAYVASLGADYGNRRFLLSPDLNFNVLDVGHVEMRVTSPKNLIDDCSGICYRTQQALMERGFKTRTLVTTDASRWDHCIALAKDGLRYVQVDPTIFAGMKSKKRSIQPPLSIEGQKSINFVFNQYLLLTLNPLPEGFVYSYLSLCCFGGFPNSYSISLIEEFSPGLTLPETAYMTLKFDYLLPGMPAAVEMSPAEQISSLVYAQRLRVEVLTKEEDEAESKRLTKLFSSPGDFNLACLKTTKKGGIERLDEIAGLSHEYCLLAEDARRNLDVIASILAKLPREIMDLSGRAKDTVTGEVRVVDPTAKPAKLEVRDYILMGKK